MRIGLEIEVSDKELLGRLANVKEKKEALDRAMAQLESCITSRYEAKTKDENVIASNIKSVPVEDILKEGMI